MRWLTLERWLRTLALVAGLSSSAVATLEQSSAASHPAAPTTLADGEPGPAVAADFDPQLEATLSQSLAYPRQEFAALNGKCDGRLIKLEALSNCNRSR